MTKISNPRKTKKHRGRKFKKSLLDVPIASHESEIPSNVSVTQANNSSNNREETVQNKSNGIINNNVNLLNNQNNLNYMLFNKFEFIEKSDNNYQKFPGYNIQFFCTLKKFVLSKKLNEFLNRSFGASTYKDLQLLLIPEAWLNDVIIQQYFNLIKNHCNNNVFVFDSFFYDELNIYGMNGFMEKKIKNIDLINYSKILVPTHLYNHWVLLVVDINARKIIYYDSLEYFEYIKPKLMVLKNFMNLYYTMKHGGNGLDDILITDTCCGMSPKQENSSDCGIFTCINAVYSVHNKPSNFKQSDINLFRHKMAYEMISCKLLITNNLF